MNFNDLAQNMSPDVYSRLREAIELGYWPNQVALTKEQKELCLEATIKYEITNNIKEQDRTGYISQNCSSDSKPEPEAIPAVDVTTEQL